MENHYHIYGEDQFNIDTRFRDYNSLRELVIDLENFREELKSSNPGFTIMMRTRPCAHSITYFEKPPEWWFPRDENDCTCRGTISIVSVRGKWRRSERVINDFQKGVKEVLEKHGIKEYKR